MDSNKGNKRALALPEMDSKKRKLDSFFPTRKQFLESAMPQEFPLPMPIMKYICSNPSSPQVYQKLIKSCKLFFLKNSILVLNSLEYDYNYGWKCCIANECGRNKCKKEHKKLDMEKLKNKKIWVAQKFDVLTEFGLNATPNFVSQFIPNIFRYNVKVLRLFYQDLSYDELKFLSTGDVKEYFLSCNTVKYDSGEPVTLENIIQLLSGAKLLFINFYYESHNAACKSYDTLIEACATIKKVVFYLIPVIFDVQIFYQHLKKSKNLSLIDIFSSSNSQRLNEVVDEILGAESFDFIPPVIRYFDHDISKLKKIEEIQAEEASKYR